MRIAFILNSLGIGGTERQVVGLAERMQARGHEVIIVALLPPVSHHWPTRVDVVHLNMDKTPLRVVRGVARALHALRSFQPDILHCHNFHGNILGRMLKLALPRACVISTIHNVYEGGWLRMTAYRLTDCLSWRTVGVFVGGAEHMVRAGATHRDKSDWVANGIDVAGFAPNSERRNAVRKQMGITDEFVWLAVGRLVPAKDHANLLLAFSVVHAEHKRAVLWIAGEGTGPYAEELRAAALPLERKAMLRWLGFRGDIAAVMDAADGFSMSSAWEGMPLALGEAMAMEKPVVTTAAGGAKLLVGDCGSVVPRHNPDALAAAMSDIMQRGAADREDLGRAARRRIVENYSMDKNAEEWEKMYISALSSHVR